MPDEIKTEKYSYSKLSVFDNCPLRFKLRYEDKHFSSSSSLALEIGTIAHKCKELIAIDLIYGTKPDYSLIKDILFTGYYCHHNNVGKDHNVDYIPGVEALKKKYSFDWIAEDTKSNLTYDQKVEIFLQHLPDMENDTEWHPIAVELPFAFDFDGNIISGFIDKVEQNSKGDLRVVDYKTSKATYDEAKLKTPMQMVIYDIAIQNIYGKAPVEHLYDFVFLGKTQLACSKGYEARGRKKLKKWFDSINGCRASGVYKPNPTPLCHWCDFCPTNPNAENKLKALCPYYSLWTPTNRVYDVAKEYTEKEEKVPQNTAFWF